MKLRTKCAAALAVVAMMAFALVPSASAKATLDTLTQANGAVTATWTLDAGSSSWFLEVATSDARDPYGYFYDFNVVGYADTDGAAESYSFPNSLPPGTYWAYIVTTPTFITCWINVNDPNCILDISNTLSVTVPAPPPPPPPPPPDTVVALGKVTAASSQDVDKLAVTLSPGEAVKATLSGSVSVPGASKVFRFTTVSKSVGAGVKAKLALKLKSKAKKAVKRALKRKKTLKAKLTLLVTDGAGNKKTSKFTVRLKP